MLRFTSIGGLALVASFALLHVPHPTAHACGGCFGPVGQPSTVTAHRMALAISTTETNQWVTRMRAVLPVEALSEDLVLQASDQPERPGFINVTNERNRPSGMPPISIGNPDADAIPPTAMLAGWLALIATALLARRRMLAMRAR